MNAVSRSEAAQLAQLASATVTFELNGQPVTGRADRTIIEIAKDVGIAIPHLCYKEGLATVGNCRA
jgi:formate dehydrogenase major subunit